ncbi:P-loop containing nucleoside triphosphate hydrolase protein [Syncephalis plumigaleata]|nr:P-loop containing nucleoside triphosphate hydrolase protein [Syncephalis plumigaleata]
MSDFDITATFKLLLIGNTNVGKSSILLRFTDDAFLPPEEVSATIGVDFKVKVIEYDDRKYKLTIWDTAGQERFRTLTSSYYRGAKVLFLVIYDVTNRDTFDELNNWLQELNLYTNNGNIIKMIVGNKVDKESDRVVSREEGKALADQLGTLFVECSAKTRHNINIAMEQLVEQIINKPELWQKPQNNNRLLSNGNTPTNENGWCLC